MDGEENTPSPTSYHFPFFQTHHHTLPHPTTKENEISTKDKILKPQHTLNQSASHVGAHMICKRQLVFIYFILFYFYLPHNNYKNLGREEKKKWRGDLTETIGAYERLGLLELQARAV